MSELLLTNIGQLATPLPSSGSKRGPGQAAVQVVEGAYIRISGHTITEVGPMDKLGNRGRHQTRVLDVEGKTVIPGLVDPHTHACFGGWRVEEFAARLAGASYMDILEAGGGILATVNATRALSEKDLARVTSAHLDEMLAHGTTTAEVKSGYGLSTAEELKQLRAIRQAAKNHRVDVVATFLGAHAVPPEYRDDPSAYVDVVVDETLPVVARQDLARYVDVFCEPGAFSPEQSRRILRAAQKLGFSLRLHADELQESGGARLAAQLGADSADHLLAASSEGIASLANSARTTAILLPGTALSLGLKPRPLGRQLVDQGVPVALATDFNPGSSPTTNMIFVMALGSQLLGLTPAEALVAGTYNAAFSLGLHDRGCIAPGRLADLVLVDCPGYEHIMYRPGVCWALTVVKNGEIVNHGVNHTGDAEGA